jgi:hypothetical protein
MTYRGPHHTSTPRKNHFEHVRYTVHTVATLFTMPPVRFVLGHCLHRRPFATLHEACSAVATCHHSFGP